MQTKQSKLDIYQQADNASLYDAQSLLLEFPRNAQVNVVAGSHAESSIHKARTCSPTVSSIRRLQAEAEFQMEK